MTSKLPSPTNKSTNAWEKLPKKLQQAYLKRKINPFILVGGSELFFAEVDAISSALRIITSEHAEIHEEHHYFVSDVDVDIDTIAAKYWRVTAPDTTTRIHFKLNVIVANEALLELYENPTINAAGTALTIFNNDRNSNNTATLTAFKDTTVTAEGTLLVALRIAASKTQALIIGLDNELILKQNTDYTIKITTDANDNEASILMEWYEH